MESKFIYPMVLMRVSIGLKNINFVIMLLFIGSIE
nr:MAG TPA: hypothetical protein [Caudoviricetes sp.]